MPSMQRDFNVTRLGHGTPNRLSISRRRIYQSARLDHRQANVDVYATGYRSNTRQRRRRESRVAGASVSHETKGFCRRNPKPWYCGCVRL